MAEKQQDLGRKPDQSPQQLSLANRLSFTYRSRLDLSTANELVMSSINSDYSDEALAVIADVKMESDIPLSSLDKPNDDLANDFYVLIGRKKPKWREERDALIAQGPRSHAVDYNLAREYSELGFWQEAKEILSRVIPRSRMLSPSAFPWVLAHVAVGQAKDKVDPSESIRETIDLLGEKGIQPQFRPFMHVKILCLLARAKGTYGADPQDMIGEAFKKTELDSGNSRSNAYLDIARVQMENSIDPKPTIDLAFEWNKGLKVEGDDWASAIQIMTWGDIAIAQIDAGLFDDVRTTINQLDSYEDPDVLCMKAELLAELAKKEAQLGLTQSEIELLTPFDIDTILASGHQDANGALEYFGLNKSLNP